MKLVINGRFLIQKITGVQRYAIEIIKEMDTLVTDDDIIVLLIPKNTDDRISLKKIKKIYYGNTNGKFWEQIVLPFYALKYHAPILSLAGIPPILTKNYMTLHDITFIKYPTSFKKSIQLWYKYFSKIAIYRAKLVFTVSEFSKKEINQYYKIENDKICVIYNAARNSYLYQYSTEVLKKYNIKENEYYLCVGSNAKHKNQKLIFDIAKKYNQTFVIVGDKQKTLESIKIEYTKNLLFTGYLEDEDLKSLYHFARGFIFPSFYEGFGIPPLEAIYNGCKCIYLSDIPVMHEIYDRGVNYINIFDKNLDFLDNNEVNMISESDVKYYLNKFSWTNSAKKIYSEIKAREE